MDTQGNTQDETTVLDVVAEMTAWLETYSTSEGLGGVWYTIESWRDELVRTTRTDTQAAPVRLAETSDGVLFQLPGDGTR